MHLGDEPLPKFDAGWAYGDLHYHSQGTDNDGESGYSYRGTLQAMGAMGLDFTFATDHASNSVADRLGAPHIRAGELVLPDARAGLRDMSPDRFAFNLDVLNGPLGGNRQVTSYPRSPRTRQRARGAAALPRRRGRRDSRGTRARNTARGSNSAATCRTCC